MTRRLLFMINSIPIKNMEKIVFSNVLFIIIYGSDELILFNELSKRLSFKKKI